MIFCTAPCEEFQECAELLEASQNVNSLCNSMQDCMRFQLDLPNLIWVVYVSYTTVGASWYCRNHEICHLLRALDCWGLSATEFKLQTSFILTLCKSVKKPKWNNSANFIIFFSFSLFIFLGIIRKTRTVMECLHRFCRECIDKSMRMGYIWRCYYLSFLCFHSCFLGFSIMHLQWADWCIILSLLMRMASIKMALKLFGQFYILLLKISC